MISAALRTLLNAWAMLGSDIQLQIYFQGPIFETSQGHRRVACAGEVDTIHNNRDFIFIGPRLLNSLYMNWLVQQFVWNGSIKTILIFRSV